MNLELKQKRKPLHPSMFIGQNGSDTISFGSGQPDLEPPKEVTQAMDECTDFKYGNVLGNVELRELLARKHNTEVDNIIIK